MNEDSLNSQDVLNLAKNPSSDNKGIIAEKLGSLYNSRNITPSAIKLAEDIFRIMVRDAELKVRETLANILKNCSNLPKDVVDSILNDTSSVAVPFIQYYSSLTDEDLIKIIASQKIDRQKAIASRQNVSANVSDYIVNNCSPEIVGFLISNEGADIKEKTFDNIVNKYPEDEDIKKRMVYRSDLPVSIIEKIVNKLSINLKNHLILNHSLPKDLASNLVEEVKEKITLSISEEFSSDKQIEELVHQLYKANRLTSGLIVRAICLGDLSFFEYALVYLSETPIAEVRKILFNNQADFMIRNLLRKAFIPKSMFPAIFSALKIVREIKFDCGRSNRKLFGHKVIERILSYIKDNEELSPDDIQYLVSKIN